MRNEATTVPFLTLALALAVLLGFSFLAQAGPRDYCALGGVATKKAAFDKAIEYLTRCIDEADLDDDELVLVLSARASSHELNGQSRNAIEDLNRAIEIEPNDPNSYVNRGTTLLKAGFRTLTVNDFDRAIELGPSAATPYFLRGLAEFELAQFVEAIANYDQAILLDPNDTRFYVHRANAYTKIGKYGIAISEYSRAIDLNPNDAEFYTYRASVYFEIGDTARGNADLERALEIDPDMLER